MPKRGLGVAIACVIVIVGGCGPVYDGPNVRPNKPPTKRPPKTVDEPPPIAWDNNCVSRFNEPNTRVKRDNATALARYSSGNVILDQIKNEKTPKDRAGKIVAAINTYKDGLQADPYAAEPTYALAIAYAKLRRKRCALDLLARLYALTHNPTYGQSPESMINASLRETELELFRDEATRAVGR